MATQLTLYNNALLLVGERKLSSISENREVRRLLDTVWDRPAVDDCLERGLWNFAMRSVEINYSPSINPSFGYQYAFDRPSDLVRSAAVCSDEYFNSPLTAYQIEGDYWYSDADPIYVRYISNGASYGYNYAGWPANFTRFVEAYLAEAIVQRVTQDEKEWLRIKSVLKDNLTRAQSTDAMEQPTTFLPRGSWAAARGGGGGGDRGNNSSLIG